VHHQAQAPLRLRGLREQRRWPQACESRCTCAPGAGAGPWDTWPCEPRPTNETAGIASLHVLGAAKNTARRLRMGVACLERLAHPRSELLWEPLRE
jgi:hypothetical protein